MEGFDRYNSHAQKQPISFKGTVPGTRGRWKMKYTSVPFSSQYKPNVVSQVAETRRQELCSTRWIPSAGSRGPAGKQPALGVPIAEMAPSTQQ